MANSTSEKQFEFKGIIPTSPPTQIWHKTSIGFTLAQKVNIPDVANDLGIAHINLDNAPDVVLAGAEHAHALDLLRKKYPQYRTMVLTEKRNPVIAITPTKIVSWGTF